MVIELLVENGSGGVLRAWDSSQSNSSDESLAIFWLHGSPQSGAPLQPVLDAASRRNVRVVSYARPSYSDSTPRPGRNVAAAADDLVAVADARGVERFALVGASGGGPHVLAAAARHPARVIAAVCLASPAPYTDSIDWYAGMQVPGGLLAAARGREARTQYAETAEFDEQSFTAADYAALEGPWRSLAQDAGEAGQQSPDGLIDDDVALASPWGFEISSIAVPILLVQGGADRVIPRAHAELLLRDISSAELWLRPRDGHVSVLNALPVCLDWLLARQ